MQFEDLKHVMASVFCVDPALITLEATPDDVPGWDSLRLLELVLAIEENFGVELPADRLSEMMSGRAIFEIVKTSQAPGSFPSTNRRIGSVR